jgi:hypothetical protein
MIRSQPATVEEVVTVWEREKIATIQYVPTLGKSSVWCLARSALTEPFSTSGVGEPHCFTRYDTLRTVPYAKQISSQTERSCCQRIPVPTPRIINFTSNLPLGNYLLKFTDFLESERVNLNLQLDSVHRKIQHTANLSINL